MVRQPRQKLTLAELLVVLALVGILLGLARNWWDVWEAEEWTLAAAWMGAWLLGVVGGRALIFHALGPAIALCSVAIAGVAVYFQFSWTTTFILVVAALVAALGTGGLPWLLSRGGTWLARMFSTKPQVQRASLLGLAAAALVFAVSAATVSWFHRPLVSTTVIRKFESVQTKSANRRQDRGVLHCMSDGGRYLVLWNRGRYEIFDTHTETTRVVPTTSQLSVTTISPDGRWLGCVQHAAGDLRNTTAVCVDADTGARLVESRTSFANWVIVFPDNESFAVGTLSTDAKHFNMELWRLGPPPTSDGRWRFPIPAGARLGAISADGKYGRLELVERSPLSRWQIWKLTPPAELILESTDSRFPIDPRFHANGTWFANRHGFWNRSLTAEAVTDGVVLGIDPAGNHVAVLHHEARPAASQIGLRPEVIEQLPFWRLQRNASVAVQLWLYDLHRPGQTWQSPARRVRPFFHNGTPVFSPHIAPNRSAFALQDDRGRIVLWRIHQSPFDD
jgi:hypothetical protein